MSFKYVSSGGVRQCSLPVDREKVKVSEPRKMFALILSTLLFLGVTPQVSTQGAQDIYETHVPAYVHTTTSTVYETVTKTHTLRETSTTDVWITDHYNHECVVTDYTTIWDFVPEDPDTRVSIIKVTSTPVYVVTATSGYNPVKTFVSVFTDFVTTTETVEFVQSITHIDVVHQIHTVPVVTTQELVQQITTTYTHIVTTTVTSYTQAYY